jgi:glycosyltransferase involved in cell wall biosynthesis
MKDVLLLTLDYPPTFIGGISAWSSDLAGALHGADHHVTVVAKRCGDTRQHDNDQPYEVIRAWGRSWNRWQALWMRMSAGKHITSNTLVLSATWKLTAQIHNTIRKKNAELAIAFHGSEITELSHPPVALQQAVDAAHYLFPVSAFLGEQLVRLGCIQPGDPRMHVLPMPLDVDPTLHQKRSVDLICVARPTPRKRIDRAVQIAQATGRTLHLVGPTEGPPGTVVHGPLSRAETLKLIAVSKAIILTPGTNAQGLGEEGLGLVLLEAAAHGVPAIGCSTGGIPEAVGPGLLLDDPDDPNGEKINAWLSDTKLGENARTWVRAHHGPKQCLSVLEGALL